ncbi:peroxiredoxin [Saccharothrix deserti]|uniref:peroxiredoxin n=1 Tax=Saccharothrix deserti TaxID=2593674 RepID=UPI00192E6443|nr:peroxiredoxin [Saccharothrix deserti]
MNPEQLPDGLPVPSDDGAADHLPGSAVPALALPTTDGREVDLAALGQPRAVLYVYPMTARPGVPSPDGWDQIPGARGCTPESCGFRDHHAELAAAGAQVCGLSSQDTDYQAEAVTRLRLPFPLISDSDMLLARQLALPTFTVGDLRLYKRITLVLRDHRVEHVFYPVFPPDRHAQHVLDWLHANPTS